MPACNPESKFALGGKWGHSYVCNPTTGRYRHIKGTPSVPHKKRKGVKGAKRGATGFNVLTVELYRSPLFAKIAENKERFKQAVKAASQKWQSMTPEQQEIYKERAKSFISKKIKAVKVRQPRKVTTSRAIIEEDEEEMAEDIGQRDYLRGRQQEQARQAGDDLFF
jgi:hypothetical protein